MPAPRRPAKPPRHKKPVETVGEFLERLDHPLKSEIMQLRRVILDADPAVSEGVKWNAPSFRTTEFFATFHLRARDAVQLILHRGARRRAGNGALEISDPAGLLVWLDDDRASITFARDAAFAARRDALGRIIRQWIKHV